MPEVARKGDTISTGHGCDTTSTIKGSASKTYCNNILIARKSDAITLHNVPSGSSCPAHSVNILGGLDTVIVEGKAIARKNDSVDMNKITGHSPNVFAG